MANRSSIAKLDPRLKDAVDDLLRDGRHTLDEILAHLASLNAGAAPISRTALGRYAKTANDQMARYREAQEVAKVWVQKLEAEPAGDVARLLPEMLRGMAFQTLANMEGEGENAAGVKEIALLAKALKDLGSATKSNVDIELVLRDLRAKASAAAEKVASIAKKGGISADGVSEIRKMILGITSHEKA